MHLPKILTRIGEVAAIHMPVKNPNKHESDKQNTQLEIQGNNSGGTEAAATVAAVNTTGLHQAQSQKRPEQTRPTELHIPIAAIKQAAFSKETPECVASQEGT